MASLRTNETLSKYEKVLAERSPGSGCPLCKTTSLAEFKHWRIVENQFPYDLIASTHHMMITNRHTKEEELNFEEKAEWEELKQGYVNDNYEYIIEATKKGKTVPNHFHIHLVIAK